MSLRALTLWRPWTWAICYAGKRIENRPWRAPQTIMNQYLALHAGKTYDKNCVALMRELGLSEPPQPRRVRRASWRSARWCVAILPSSRMSSS